MRLNRFANLVAVAALALAWVCPAKADKLPYNIDAWGYREADFFSYSVHAAGNPILSIDNRFPQGSPQQQYNPTPVDAGSPVVLDMYFDTFSNEFQFQIGYTRGVNGEFPTSIAFVVTDGVFPDTNTPGETDRWALFLVDATDPTNPVLTVCPFDPMSEPAGRGPFLTSCIGENPILSTLRASDNIYTGEIPFTDINNPTTNPNGWQTGLSNPNGIFDETGQQDPDYPLGRVINRRVSASNRDFFGLETREFTVNVDATPILNFFNSNGAPGMGMRGQNIDLNDPNARPVFSLRSVAYFGAGFQYANEVLTDVVVPAPGLSFLQSHLVLVGVTVTDRCPINCVGDIYGTVGPNNVCAPVVPPTPTPTPSPTPTTSPVACSRQEFVDNLALDSATTGIFELINYSTRRVTRLARGVKGRRRLVSAAQANQAAAEDAFIESWTASWSFPQVVVSCEDGILPADCRVESFTAQTQSYLTSSTLVRDLSEENIRLIRQIRRQADSTRKKKTLRRLIKRLRSQTNNRYDEVIAFSKAIPQTSVQCTSTQL